MRNDSMGVGPGPSNRMNLCIVITIESERSRVGLQCQEYRCYKNIFNQQHAASQNSRESSLPNDEFILVDI
jgi:hypothetical protein